MFLPCFVKAFVKPGLIPEVIPDDFLHLLHRQDISQVEIFLPRLTGQRLFRIVGRQPVVPGSLAAVEVIHGVSKVVGRSVLCCPDPACCVKGSNILADKSLHFPANLQRDQVPDDAELLGNLQFVQ